MNAASQFLQVLTARVTHGQDTRERQADTGDDEAQDSPPDVDACGLTHGCREDQVPSTEKQREQHKPDGYRSVSLIFSHNNTPPNN